MSHRVYRCHFLFWLCFFSVLAKAAAVDESCALPLTGGNSFPFPSLLVIDVTFEFSACGTRTSCGRGVMACLNSVPLESVSKTTVWHRHSTMRSISTVTEQNKRIRLVCHETREEMFVGRDTLHVITPHACGLVTSANTSCLVVDYKRGNMFNFTSLDGLVLSATGASGDTYYYGFCSGVEMKGRRRAAAAVSRDNLVPYPPGCAAGLSAVCRQFKGNGSCETYGLLNETEWTPTSSPGVIAKYTQDRDRTRADVFLQCMKNATMPHMLVKDEHDDLAHLWVNTVCACPGGCVVEPPAPPSTPCVVTGGETGTVYNFTSLESLGGVSATTPDNDTVVYNFCQGIAYPPACVGAGVCLIDTAGNARSLGALNSAVVSEVANIGVSVAYYAPAAANEASSGAVVTLRCNKNAVEPLLSVVQVHSNVYTMTLDTCFACIDPVCVPPICTFTGPTGDKFEFSVPARPGGYFARYGTAGTQYGGYNYCFGYGKLSLPSGMGSVCYNGTSAACVVMSIPTRSGDTLQGCSAGQLRTVIYVQTEDALSVDAYYFKGFNDARMLAHLVCAPNMTTTDIEYHGRVSNHYEFTMSSPLNCKVN